MYTYTCIKYIIRKNIFENITCTPCVKRQGLSNALFECNLNSVHSIAFVILTYGTRCLLFYEIEFSKIISKHHPNINQTSCKYHLNIIPALSKVAVRRIVGVGPGNFSPYCVEQFREYHHSLLCHNGRVGKGNYR